MESAGRPTFLATAALVATKDLEIEWRSRAVTVRALPFVGVLVLLFAVALDPDRGLLPRLAPGLFWLAALLGALLAIGQHVAIERGNRTGASLLHAGLDPAAMFLGKAAALLVELLALELLLALVMVALYDVTVSGAALAAGSLVLATAGIAAAGTLYGAFVAGAEGGRDSLLALLVLPVLLPVLLAGTQLLESATAGASGGDAAWLGLLAVFAALYASIGALTFGPLLEEA
jgi:heme exporter protein B